jgi:maleamate amidohydrolase
MSSAPHSAAIHAATAAGDAWRSALPPDEREIYAAAGYGRDAGLGDKPALVVVDATVNFTGDRREPILDSIRRYPHSCGAQAWDSVAAIARLLDTAHAAGAPVVFTHGPVRKTSWSLGGWARTSASGQLPEEDARGESFVAEIQPRADDVVLEKLRPSAFFGTPLASLLFDAGRDTVVLCGGTASGCVRASAIDAFSYGFRLCVVEEATFDRSSTSRSVNLFEIDQKYGNVLGVDAAIELLGGVRAQQDRRVHASITNTEAER